MRQERFTGDASHELRTPLTAVLGQIEVALRRERAPHEYQRVLSSVHGQVQRLQNMVEMLLFLARADAEAKLPDRVRTDLSAWLNDHLEARAGQPRAQDLRLESPDAESYFVDVQAPLLGQLLDNLLENASKYSADGTPIVLRLARQGGRIALTVEDEGCGIPAEDLPHVFEPFYRSSRARRAGTAGVGLGLAVAQRIARAFGGTLVAESELGRGSRFTLHLPEACVELQSLHEDATELDISARAIHTLTRSVSEASNSNPR
jgi:signal transduction histidine kinase